MTPEEEKEFRRSIAADPYTSYKNEAGTSLKRINTGPMRGQSVDYILAHPNFSGYSSEAARNEAMPKGARTTTVYKPLTQEIAYSWAVGDVPDTSMFSKPHVDEQGNVSPSLPTPTSLSKLMGGELESPSLISGQLAEYRKQIQSPMQQEVQNRVAGSQVSAPAQGLTPGISPQDYQVRSGESTEAYRAKIAALFPGGGGLQGEIASRAGVTGAGGGQTFQYVDKSGQVKTFNAADSTSALANMPADAAPDSGVSLVSGGGGAGGPGGVGGGTPPSGLPSGLVSGGGSAQDILVNKLVDALAQSQPAGGLEGQYRATKEAAGVTGLETQVGTFNEEIVKARDLLSTFDAQLRRGMNKEEARLAPMELITGRQAELQRQSGETRGDLLAVLDKLSFGKGLALEELSRKDRDVLTTMGFKEADLQRPIEDLKTELSLRSAIQETIQSQFPGIVSSTYDDKGNLTMILQDPSTGGFSTKTLPGIGKVTQKDITEGIKEVRGGLFDLNTGTWIVGPKADTSVSDKLEERTIDMLKDFNKDLTDRESLDYLGNREAFIRQLQARYPEIDQGDISRKVYEVYPDFYNK